MLLLAVQFIVPVAYFATPYFLANKFKNIGGWSLTELMLCFGVINLAFALAEMLARGFDMFARQIVSGDFDRMLVRPRSLELQVMGSLFEFSRLGKTIMPVIVFSCALEQLPQLWQPGEIMLLLFLVLSGVAIFGGVFVLQASLCFWTTQGLEVANIFTNGGQMAAQYPLSIYRKWLRVLFTAIIPFGCATYLPLSYLLEKPGYESVWCILAPVVGFVFILPCLCVWRYGVSKYLSTGS